MDTSVRSVKLGGQGPLHGVTNLPKLADNETVLSGDDIRVKADRRRRANKDARPKWRPIPAWSWMLAAAIAVALTAFVVTTWLLTIASHAAPGTDRATARLDAVRTGLAAGAGAGAAVGLMLAFRRQHHQEIATVLTDLDATERRITELYTKAVEQLGNEKAPVRLGGLYALERLAQDNPAQRPTIVNVICAYLRMPFPAAAPASKPEPAAGEGTSEPAAATETESFTADDTWQQERQVRLAAQRILSEHLRGTGTDKLSTDSPSTSFWPRIRLDLTGATLIDFNFDNTVVSDALFGGATFSGDTSFGEATFSGDTSFGEATFSGDTSFGEATFSGDTSFGGATFSGDARFGRATFSGTAFFGGATFHGGATFNEATFGGANFGGATFSGNASFGRATFRGTAFFGGATFRSVATFGGATFLGDALFSGAAFGGIAVFTQATFSGAVRFDQATFIGIATFGKATFNSGPNALSFTDAHVPSSGGRNVWPPGWRVSQEDSDRPTVVRGNDDDGS